MRISDWSSDVCSSDLEPAAQTRGKPRGMAAGWWALEGCPGVRAGVASDGWWGGGAADHELGGEDVVGDLGGRRRAGVGGVGFTGPLDGGGELDGGQATDRKSTRLNSSH